MNPDSRDETPQPEPAQRPYEKPAIIWENEIDTKALSIGCGKIGFENATCSSVPQS